MEILIEKLPGVIISFVFGLAFGSFSTMASHRIPKHEDIFIKPSNCPKCKHRLGIVDLFPLFSWIFSKGKCRYCKTKVSIRYPLIELLLGTLFLIIYLKAGLSLYSLSLFALAVCLVIIIVIDLEHQIIPDTLQLTMIPIGLLYRYSLGSVWHEYIAGPILGLSIALCLRYGFWLWKKREGLGMGDVKFFCVAGLFLGVKGLVPFMLFSGLIGIVTALIWKKMGKGEEFPFAPALVMSLLLCTIIPEYTVNMLYL